ncbi:MAG TPA: hypothetical protein VGF69_21515, partial [Thermoanaerobaculia bacterium]
MSGGTDGGFPGTARGAQPNEAANTGVESDVYIAAFSLDLRTLLGATYFGGDNTDFGAALAVTADSVYVTGTTLSTNLPGTAGSAFPATERTHSDGLIRNRRLRAQTDKSVCPTLNASVPAGARYSAESECGTDT